MPTKPSEICAVLGAVDPQSANAVKTSGWISTALFRRLMAVVQVGAMTATGTVDAKFQQATSAAGAGAKDVTGTSITQLTAAGTDDNKQVVINLSTAQLDVAGGFAYVRLSITPATAASLISGLVLGFDPRTMPASDNDATTVDEIVN